MKFTNKTRYSAFAAVLALGLVTAGCGGGSSSSSATPAGATSLVQVRIGDAPADWIMAFGMNVNSITLTSRSGGTVNVLSSATPMEMMNLMGTVQPLTMANVPQGTYTQATVNLSSISMGYMDPTTHKYVHKTVAGNYSGTVTFNPAMTIGSESSVLGFDMNMANSVSIDGSGNVTITPAFTAMMNPTSSTSQNPWQGYMQGLVGSVSSTNGSQFTMSMMMGQQSVSFATNSSTQFEGMSGMGEMSSGRIVMVDATTQPDGSLLAQHVTSMWSSSSGMMGAGLVGSLTGTPPTQLTMAADNGIGGGMMMSNIAQTIGINIAGGTTYSVDTDNGNIVLTGLPFTPTFNASTIALGQKIDVVSGSGMMSGGTGGGMMGGSTSATIDANQIQLEEQGMHGTVSNYNGSSFTLTMPSDSAFTTLTGMSAITVYQQPGTQMFPAGSTVTNNSQVEVRGLLFDDSGAYKMVSTWIVTPAATT
jgi:Domain of unknown function (DUF5666)